MRYIIVALLLVAACTAPPEDVARADVAANVVLDTESNAQEVPINLAESSFTFTGYGPGKSHEGTFDQMEGVLFINNGQVVGARGTIMADSVNTGIGGLDNHLKSEDFFDVSNYPTIEMESTQITDGRVTGTLAFHGVTREITFPVTVTGNSLSADFVFDMSEYGVSYTGANDEVRIQFTLTA